MARKKTVKPIEADVAKVNEEVIEESVTDVTNEIVDEAAPAEIVEAEEVIDEVAEKVADDKSNQFIYAQLKAINKLSNPAKARRLAERVLRNRK